MLDVCISYYANIHLALRKVYFVDTFRDVALLNVKIPLILPKTFSDLKQNVYSRTSTEISRVSVPDLFLMRNIASRTVDPRYLRLFFLAPKDCVYFSVPHLRFSKP